jgi:hypothetical protein
LAATLFLEHEAWRDALDKFIRARSLFGFLSFFPLSADIQAKTKKKKCCG